MTCLQVTCPDFFAFCPSSKGDIVDPNLKSQYNTYRLPALVKRILAIILKPIVSVWMCLTFTARSARCGGFLVQGGKLYHPGMLGYFVLSA